MRCVVFRELGWCGECYAIRKGRESRHGGPHSGPPRRRGRRAYWMPLKKPQVAAGEGASPVWSEKDVSLSGKVPHLIEFLSSSVWADGTSRVTGTATLLFADGSLKIALNCRDSNCSAFVSGSSLSSVLRLADEALGADRVEWRSKDRVPGRKRAGGGA